jgi:hypothetical protein
MRSCVLVVSGKVKQPGFMEAMQRKPDMSVGNFRAATDRA